MALTQPQQILELIKKSENILITCPQNWNIDSIAACLAWQKILTKLNKKTLVVCDDFQPTNKIHFLPNLNNVQLAISNLQRFIISLDLTKTDIAAINYKKTHHQLDVYITPQHGEFSSKDVSSKLSTFKFDLTCTLNAPDLESLGQIYSDHLNFFYQTPIINIDHQPINENYGQINLVDIKAMAISEILFNLISLWDVNLIDDEIATCLLAGLYNKTWGFKSNKITPQTLNTAAQLINLGAKKDDIVYNLYQKKSLPTLKLWGRILAKLQQIKESKLIWSTITHQDFIKSGTTNSDLSGIIEELISTTPQAEIIFLLYEINDHQVGGIIYNTSNLNILNIFKKYQAKGTNQKAKFIIHHQSLPEVERQIIKDIQTGLLN